MSNEKFKKNCVALYKRSAQISRDFAFFVRQVLGHKKIVIISEKGISSLPVSFKIQAMMVGSLMLFMLWVSYSTGKYFAYEGIISEKDREIWTTNITNENLQYQVSDLHNNLMELNKYFDNIKKLDQLVDKKEFKKGEEYNISDGKKSPDAEEHAKKLEQEKQEGVKNILSNIRGKVLERISSLENVIEMTGLNVSKVAANNKNLRDVIPDNNINEDASNHQGGIYIPVDEEEFNRGYFDKEVNYLIQLEKIIHSFPLASPMKRYWVSSGYGHRVDPIKKRKAMHAGIDLVGHYQSKVYSSAPGVVKHAGNYGAYGRFIELDHGSGITTRYAHLSKIFVKKGDKIDRGFVIGLQGNSGRSTGTHLHYEVRYNNKAYDPSNFLKAGKYVF